MIQLLERAWIDTRWKTPETEVIEEPGFFQIVNPTNPSVAYNSVYFSALNGSSIEIDQKLEVALQRFKSARASYRWIVGPSSAPKDLVQRLSKRGMSLNHIADGLIVEVDQFRSEPVPDISVEQLTNSNLAEYTHISAEGWSLPQELRAKMHEEIRRGLNDPNSPYVSYLARYKGKPAGTGVVHYAPDYGMLKGGSVGPEFRGKGVYRALVFHRIGELRKRGIAVAATHAKKDTSSPICQRVGFKRICEFQVLHS